MNAEAARTLQAERQAAGPATRNAAITTRTPRVTLLLREWCADRNDGRRLPALRGGRVHRRRLPVRHHDRRRWARRFAAATASGVVLTTAEGSGGIPVPA